MGSGTGSRSEEEKKAEPEVDKMAAATNTRRTTVYSDRRTMRNNYRIEGNAVRRLEPSRRTRPAQTRPVRVQAQVSRPDTAGNRERALQMNLGYVLFLTAMAVFTVFLCVNYLQLQAKSTKLRREVTALESSLDALRLENDLDYDRVMTGIDMEHVKDVAMNELGMVYISKKQIITYNQQDSDYVRQYEKIP